MSTSPRLLLTLTATDSRASSIAEAIVGNRRDSRTVFAQRDGDLRLCIGVVVLLRRLRFQEIMLLSQSQAHAPCDGRSVD